MPFQIDNALFLDELRNLCNKFNVYPVISYFYVDIPNIKVVGFAYDESSKSYVPVFQTSVN